MAAYEPRSSGWNIHEDSDSPTPIPYAEKPIEQSHYKGDSSATTLIPGTDIYRKTKGSNSWFHENASLIEESHEKNSSYGNEQRNYRQNNHPYDNQFEIDRNNKNLIHPLSVINLNKQKSVKSNDNYNNKFHDVDDCKHLIKNTDNISRHPRLSKNPCKNNVYAQCYNDYKRNNVKSKPNVDDNQRFDCDINNVLQNEGMFKLSESYLNMQQHIQEMELENDILLLKLKKKELMLKLEKIKTNINIEIEKVNTNMKLQKMKLNILKHKSRK